MQGLASSRCDFKTEEDTDLFQYKSKKSNNWKIMQLQHTESKWTVYARSARYLLHRLYWLTPFSNENTNSLYVRLSVTANKTITRHKASKNNNKCCPIQCMLNKVTPTPWNQLSKILEELKNTPLLVTRSPFPNPPKFNSNIEHAQSQSSEKNAFK